MRNAWGSRVGMVTLVGVMVLSAGLVLLTDRALADKGDRDDKGGGSATNLSGVTQNWDKNLPSASRFTVLSAFGGAAVLDNNTGLVWEKAPDTTPPVVPSIPSQGWGAATYYCVNKIVGGAVGWRLPSVIELKSVQDPSLPQPFVPATVFTSIDSSFFWSASTYASDPTLAWAVNFGSLTDVSRGAKVQSFRAWCVRGPMNADTY